VISVKQRNASEILASKIEKKAEMRECKESGARGV
jgi:hypothetical protein